MRHILTAVLLAMAVPALAADVTLTWQDNSSGLNQEAEFIIERHLARPVAGQVETELDPADSWGEVARVPTDTTTFTDSITEHRCYRVAATNAAGTSDYSNIDCTEVQIPTAPTTMELGPLSFSLRLDWGGQEVVLTGE